MLCAKYWKPPPRATPCPTSTGCTPTAFSITRISASWRICRRSGCFHRVCSRRSGKQSSSSRAVHRYRPGSRNCRSSDFGILADLTDLYDGEDPNYYQNHFSEISIGNASGTDGRIYGVPKDKDRAAAIIRGIFFITPLLFRFPRGVYVPGGQRGFYLL